MAAIPYHVAEAFIAGKRDQISRGNFRTTGNEIWTYGTLLAYKVPGDERIYKSYRQTYSVTSARHIKALESVLARQGWTLHLNPDTRNNCEGAWSKD